MSYANHNYRLILQASALLTTLPLASTFAEVITVDDDGTADYNTIQAAVDASNHGDEIVVYPGTYTGSGDEVVKMGDWSLILRSTNPDDPDVVAETIIDGEQERRGITCDSSETAYTVIEGFTISNGTPPKNYPLGGGLWSETKTMGGIAVSDCIFTNNSASDGGAIYVTEYLTGCVDDGVLYVEGGGDSDQIEAGDTILARIGYPAEEYWGWYYDHGIRDIWKGHVRISLLPMGGNRPHYTEGLLTNDTSVSNPYPYNLKNKETLDLRQQVVVIPFRHHDPGEDNSGANWEFSCNNLNNLNDFPECNDEDGNDVPDCLENPQDSDLGMWVEFTIPKDFDAGTESLAIEYCTKHDPYNFSIMKNLFIVLYKKSGDEKDLTYELMTYRGVYGNERCSPTSDDSNPNGANMALGSCILIEGTEIKGNSASNYGGGICSNSCSLEVIDVDLHSNEAGNGGGMFHDHVSLSGGQIGGDEETWIASLSFPRLYDCRFTNNSATQEEGGVPGGGGFYSKIVVRLIMDRCTFFENSTVGERGGGGAYIGNGNIRLFECTFDSNEAKNLAETHGRGGGLYHNGPNDDQNKLELDSCLVTNNVAVEQGGGIWMSSGVNHLHLTATTVCGNSLVSGDDDDGPQIFGNWTDNGGNCVTTLCYDCPADVDGNGTVDVDDLLAVIGKWGRVSIFGDVNGDGFIDTDDVLFVLANWGECPDCE